MALLKIMLSDQFRITVRMNRGKRGVVRVSQEIIDSFKKIVLVQRRKERKYVREP